MTARSLANRIAAAERSAKVSGGREIVVLADANASDATVDEFLAEHVGPIVPDDLVVRILRFGPRAAGEPPVTLASGTGLSPLLDRIAESGRRLGAI